MKIAVAGGESAAILKKTYNLTFGGPWGTSDQTIPIGDDEVRVAINNLLPPGQLLLVNDVDYPAWKDRVADDARELGIVGY